MTDTGVASTAPALPTYHNEQAWYGDEMGSRKDWIHHLSKQELDLIDGAIQHADRSVDDLTQMTSEHFPVGSFAETLKRLGRDLLHGRGFFLMRGFPVDRYSPRQRIIAFLGIGHHFGEPVSQNGKGHI